MKIHMFRIFKNSILKNTSWLIFEKISRMAVALFINVMVARYLGPEKFGILGYASSLLTFVGTFIYLGLSGIVVKELVQRPKEINSILGTTFTLKMIGAILAFVIVLVILVITKDEISGVEFTVIIILASTLFFKPFESVNIWFQSLIQAKKYVLPKSFAYILSSMIKAGVVLLGFSIIYIASAYVIESAVGVLLLIIVYVRNGNKPLQWRFSKIEAKNLLGQGWIILISGFFAEMNLRVDQVMLRWYKGTVDVGIYSVAARLSEIWYFIPAAIVLSFYPKLMQLKNKNEDEYKLKLEQLLNLLFTLGFIVAIVTNIISKPFIRILYGPEYILAGSILTIHIWAGIFIFMRELFSKWLIMENLLKYSLITHGLGALINIILNIFLIPSYSGFGAAIATLISYMTSSYLSLFLMPKTRVMAIMMTKAMLSPLKFTKYKAEFKQLFKD